MKGQENFLIDISRYDTLWNLKFVKLSERNISEYLRLNKM